MTSPDRLCRRLGAVLIAASLLAGCTIKSPPVSAGNAAVPVAAQVIEAPVSARDHPALQWLFRSAEATLIVRRSYARMTAAMLADAARTGPRIQRVLSPGSTADAPRFASCTLGQPLVEIFDGDEALIWNVGSARWFAEARRPFDPAIWAQWEATGAGRAVAMPGAADMLSALRAAGVTPVVITNRSAATAAGSIATFTAAGLGDFVHGQTVFFMGDDATRSSKDARRETVAARACVIALVGDQLGDFAQLFNERGISAQTRRDRALAPGLAGLWDAGWYLLPNPTYGPWDRMSFDDFFSPDTRWAPPKGDQ